MFARCIFPTIKVFSEEATESLPGRLQPILRPLRYFSNAFAFAASLFYTLWSFLSQVKTLYLSPFVPERQWCNG